jgi:hypothetical protein
MGDKGIRDALEREMDRVEMKEAIPLGRVVDLRLLRQVKKEF